MEQKANTFLETERIGRLMAKYALPYVISLLVAALYNIVDQIFYCQCGISWFLRQRCQHRGFSADGSGAVHCRDDWRRLLCVCQHQLGTERSGVRPQEHRQCSPAVCHLQPGFDGNLSVLSGANADPVRRISQRRDVLPCQRVFLLDYPGGTILYVRPGPQPYHPLRRKS